MKKYCMLSNYYILFIISCLISLQNSYADPILNFFFQPYPDVKTEDIHTGLRKSGYIASHKVNGMLDHNCCAGIISTYAGYLGVSNRDGQTFFPLKHHNKEKYIYIVVTDTIVPIVILGNTVNHLQFDKHAAVAYFKATKKQDDKTGLFFWDVQIEKRPHDGRIPLESLIIIAKPDYIYVPIGISPADNASDFLLPPMYVKQGIHSVENSLYVMTLSHFFRPTRIEYKKDAMFYRMQPAY